MRFMSTGKVIVSRVVLLAGVSAATLLLTGCQLDLNGSMGTKVFYPDDLGQSKIGDPRKPMYSGSGFGERSTAGSDSGVQGFTGMNKEGSK